MVMVLFVLANLDWSIFPRLGKGASALGCSAIYIESHCRYRHTESKDASQTITELLIGTSITLGVTVIDPSHTSICWHHPPRKRKSPRTTERIHKRKPARIFGGRVLRWKFFMSILDSFKHLGTQIRLSLLKVAFNLYNHILIPHSPLFIHDFFHHTDVLFSLPLFRSFGHGYEGFFFFSFLGVLSGTGKHVCLSYLRM